MEEAIPFPLLTGSNNNKPWCRPPDDWPDPILRAALAWLDILRAQPATLLDVPGLDKEAVAWLHFGGLARLWQLENGDWELRRRQEAR